MEFVNEPVSLRDESSSNLYLNPSDLSPGAPRVHRFICGNGSRFRRESPSCGAVVRTAGVHLRAEYGNIQG